MNPLSRFWAWFVRRVNAIARKAEEREPITDLMHEEMENRGTALRRMLDKHTDAGSALEEMRWEHKKAQDKIHSLEQDLDDKVAEADAAATPEMKLIAEREEARLAEELARQQSWVNELQHFVGVGFEGLNTNQLLMTDYDQQTSEIRGRYAVSISRYNATEIRKALVEALEQTSGMYGEATTGRSYIDQVERRVVRAEGGVSARESAVRGILRGRGQRVLSQKVRVSPEAQKILEEARRRAGSTRTLPAPAQKSEQQSGSSS